MTTPSPRPRVLFVDDEPDVLESLADVLYQDYEVLTAVGGAAALEILAEVRVPVVVSDMRMPGMDGATFLGKVRERAPGAVRMLLTGHADLDATVRAVNDGGIFRFLTKPCPPAAMRKAVADALEQHRVLTADRELLAERVSELTTQLLRSERLATLGTMSAAIGHEMNNSLSLMNFGLHRVSRHVDVGEDLDLDTVASLQRGYQRLVAQARQILAIARPHQRRIERIDLNGVARDMAGALRDLGISRATQIEVVVGDTPVTLDADRIELEQIVINLVKNAVDAVGQRGRSGRVRVEVVAAGDDAVLRVADNGCGIEAEHRERVFLPYFTTKASGRGTGLGLAVVKQFVDAYGGTLAFESEVGVGTTFTAALPAAD
jgi:C4-dicarboxylate-specific signal transduction histidine kinase